MTHTFHFPTDIRFGAGSRGGLPEIVRSKALRRPLLVTDRGLAALPPAAEILDLLRKGGGEPAVFSDVAGNPLRPHVVAGVEAFRTSRADSIVALGGGAALDVAKAIALLAHHPGELFDYEDGRPDARPIDGPIPFWIAIPTTAGTGSEVGRSAVISDEATHVKKIFFSPRLLAPLVLADPELTLGLPPKVTAATGMDALTHCIEAFLAKDYHPICDGIAHEGLRLGAAALPRAVADGSDLAARSDLLMASMMGAIAFQKGLGLVHSCAHALGTVFDLHHGLANGLVIDVALRHDVPAAEPKFERLAGAVGVTGGSAEFLAFLRDLKREIGIATGPVEHGLDRTARERLAELAFADSCHRSSPRPVERRDFDRIFEELFA